MLLKRVAGYGVALALGTALAPALAADEASKKVISKITGVSADVNYAEEHAYTLGVQAYEFAFPWFHNQLVRWLSSQPPRDGNTSTPANLKTNSFGHFRQLATAAYKDGGTPNNDTLYSFAWVDVGAEPMILSVPEIKDRYYSIVFMGFDSDNFDYVGTRTTGSGAGNYLIAGPGWKGSLPRGVKQTAQAHTPVFFMLARTMVTGPELLGKESLDKLHAIQDSYKLTPLSQWGKPGMAPVAATAPVWPPFRAKDDPLADWKTINRALTEVPPPARHASVLKQFAQIGIGPGLDVSKVDEATQRGLVRALDAGKRIVTGAATYIARSKPRNGWSVHSLNLGRFGPVDDFLGRAGTQSLAGLNANDPVEGLYLPTVADGDGELLTGTRNYVLRFAPNEIPPVDAFWSATIYGRDFNLVDNPINRYSLGDRSPLLRNADGGITLYLQRESPGADKEPNWLPTGEQEFKVTMRLYLPKPEVLNGQWSAPPVRRVE